MSAMMLFYVAIVVFTLMITGLYLSVREFLQVSEEPSQLQGDVPHDDGSQNASRGRSTS